MWKTNSRQYNGDSGWHLASLGSAILQKLQGSNWTMLFMSSTREGHLHLVSRMWPVSIIYRAHHIIFFKFQLTLRYCIPLKFSFNQWRSSGSRIGMVCVVDYLSRDRFVNSAIDPIPPITNNSLLEHRFGTNECCPTGCGHKCNFIKTHAPKQKIQAKTRRSSIHDTDTSVIYFRIMTFIIQSQTLSIFFVCVIALCSNNVHHLNTLSDVSTT